MVPMITDLDIDTWTESTRAPAASLFLSPSLTHYILRNMYVCTSNTVTLSTSRSFVVAPVQDTVCFGA